MKSVGRRAAGKQAESIEFVPKRDLDQVRQENEQLRKQNERLRRETERWKQETERLRRELEAALRASKHQAAPPSRGNPKANPKRPGRKPGRCYGRQACRPIPAHVDEQTGLHCRSAVRTAAAAWSRKAANHSIRKRLCDGPWCAVSTSPWAGAASASGGCRGAIGYRPRMRWESAVCSWGRRR